jgi:hypothetical protein
MGIEARWAFGGMCIAFAIGGLPILALMLHGIITDQKHRRCMRARATSGKSEGTRT